jgi:hypothetical protein
MPAPLMVWISPQSSISCMVWGNEVLVSVSGTFKWGAAFDDPYALLCGDRLHRARQGV